MEDKKDLKNRENQVMLENEKIESLIPEGVDTKNNKTIFIIILIVLCVVLLVFLGLIATGVLNNNKVTPNINEDEEVEEVEEVVEITDELKENIGLKVEHILTLIPNVPYERAMNYADYGFNYAVFFRDLTDAEKQQIVLKTVEFADINQSRYQEVPYVKNAVDTMMKYAGNNKEAIKDYYGYLTFDEVNKAYRNLFGEDLNNPLETVGKCPTFYYSSETKEFYHMSAACGGTSASSVVSYKDKYVGEKDTIELYMNFGFIRFEDMNSKEATIYGNLDSLTREDGLFSYASADKEIGKVNTNEMYNYKITEETKDSFTQYKFIFKKDSKNNNYYFDKVEKVK